MKAIASSEMRMTFPPKGSSPFGLPEEPNSCDTGC
jgi:hypothetical protein